MELSEIVRTVLQDFPYALYGSIMVGAICAFIGVYIVARRVVFFGAVLTQVSVLGLAMTFLPFFALPHAVGTLIVTLISAVILSRMLTGRKIPRDAVLGFVFVSSIAARILILQKAPKVEASEIENLLRGDILFVTPDIFFMMLGAFVLAVVIHLLFYKEFTYISFDPETARTQGFNAVIWDMVFYLVAGAGDRVRYAYGGGSLCLRLPRGPCNGGYAALAEGGDDLRHCGHHRSCRADPWTLRGLPV